MLIVLSIIEQIINDTNMMFILFIAFLLSA